MISNAELNGSIGIINGVITGNESLCYVKSELLDKSILVHVIQLKKVPTIFLLHSVNISNKYEFYIKYANDIIGIELDYIIVNDMKSLFPDNIFGFEDNNAIWILQQYTSKYDYYMESTLAYSTKDKFEKAFDTAYGIKDNEALFAALNEASAAACKHIVSTIIQEHKIPRQSQFVSKNANDNVNQEIYSTINNQYQWGIEHWKKLHESLNLLRIKRLIYLLEKDELYQTGRYNHFTDVINSNINTFFDSRNSNMWETATKLNNLRFIPYFISTGNIVHQYNGEIEGNDAKNVYVIVDKNDAVTLRDLIRARLILRGYNDIQKRVKISLENIC